MRFLILLIAAFSLSGADISGIWVGQLPTRNGESVDVAFQFIQSGSKLAGKAYGDYQSTPLTGIIAGDAITFVVVSQEQAGNQINETKLRFTGSIKAGEMELIRERERSTNAGNAGGVQFRGNPKQVLKLKRLI